MVSKNTCANLEASMPMRLIRPGSEAEDNKLELQLKKILEEDYSEDRLEHPRQIAVFSQRCRL